MEVIAKDGQTLADIAVQEFDSMEAAMELARVNGMGVTEIPGAGRAEAAGRKLEQDDVLVVQEPRRQSRDGGVGNIHGRVHGGV